MHFNELPTNQGNLLQETLLVVAFKIRVKLNENKRNDKRFNIIFLNGHLFEASVIDSKYIKMTRLQDFY